MNYPKKNFTIKTYNDKVITFPGSLFAKMFGFEREVYYEADSGSNSAPNVSDLFE